MKNKKEYQNKCAYCGKQYTTKMWICSEGLLKGKTILDTMYCHRVCELKMKKLLKELRKKEDKE